MQTADGTKNMSASNFVSWLLEDIDSIHAEAGTPRDEQLRAFEREGFLHFKGCIHGTNDYEIMTDGFRAFWAAAEVHARSMPSPQGTET